MAQCKNNQTAVMLREAWLIGFINVIIITALLLLSSISVNEVISVVINEEMKVMRKFNQMMKLMKIRSWSGRSSRSSTHKVIFVVIVRVGVAIAGII